MSAEKDREEREEARPEGEKGAAAQASDAGEPAAEKSWIERLTANVWLVSVLIVPVVMIVGIIQGAAAAILVLIAAALVTVIALFWGSVRTLLGETPLSGADAYALAAPRAEEEQKQAVLRALKDLEFERSVGKISEEDYAALVAKYRAEAKRLLRVLEEDARPRRERVEHLVRAALVEAGLEQAEPAAETHRSPPPAEEKKKKKKRRPAGDAASPRAEGAERRVEIEPIDEGDKPAEPKRSDKPKAHVDITWKSPPLPAKTQESAAYVPPAKKCAECGTKNDPDANFCKKCGSKAFERGKAKVEVKTEAAGTGDGSAQEAPDGAKAAEDEASAHETAEGDAPAEETAR